MCKGWVIIPFLPLAKINCKLNWVELETLSNFRGKSRLEANQYDFPRRLIRKRVIFPNVCQYAKGLSKYNIYKIMREKMCFVDFVCFLKVP